MHQDQRGSRESGDFSNINAMFQGIMWLARFFFAKDIPSLKLT